jgi:hypothetical protein
MGLKTSLACHAACFGIADTLSSVVNIFDGMPEDAAINGQMLEAKALAEMSERIDRAKWFYQKRKAEQFIQVPLSV